MKHTIIALTLGLMLTLTILLLPGSVQFGNAAIERAEEKKIIYVNQNITSPGNGTSWDTAYKFLQNALDDAKYGDQIWVAAGVYTPTNTSTRKATFQLKAGVELYGGFAGGEEALNKRSWYYNLTILSGDLEGNDITKDGVVIDATQITGKNAYHVVTGNGVTETARLDGFFITAGTAIVAGDDGMGGGMFNKAGSPTLINITFQGNRAIENGGGMYNIESSNPTLKCVDFVGNQANSYGGGMYNADSNPSLIHTTFKDNIGGSGGGMYNKESSPSLSNVVISHNQANSDEKNDYTNRGGGIYSLGESNPQLTNVRFEHNEATHSGGGMYGLSNRYSLTNVTFYDNEARYGGGLFNDGTQSSTLTDVSFINNRAGKRGGGLYSTQSHNNIMTNITFIKNVATDNGGGMYTQGSDYTLASIIFNNNQAANNGGGIHSKFDEITLNNALFYNNHAEQSGGGITHYSDVIITNATFSGNQASFIGGAVHHLASDKERTNARLTLINCILWGNQAERGADIGTEIESGESAIIQIGYIHTVVLHGGGADALRFDPLFVDPDHGDFHLRAGSPAIDAGDPDTTTLAIIDLDGRPRILDGDADGEAYVDIGAYEFRPPIHVFGEAKGPEHTGVSWTRAYTNVQDALANVNPGDEIWVAQGKYFPDEGKGQTDNNPSATFQLKPGVALYGGFAAVENELNERDPSVNVTILSGDIDNDDTTDDYGIVINPEEDIKGTNAYHVVDSDHVTETALLDGFTITAGYANGTQRSDQDGGGIYNEMGNPTMANIIFRGNRASMNGGGVFNSFGNSAMTNVVFSNNLAGDSGGGMYNTSSSPTLDKVTFSENQANQGGGMFNYRSSNPILTDVTFNNNQAERGGGMVNSINAYTHLTNVTFNSNKADYGGGVYNIGTFTTLDGVIFEKNRATLKGGGMYSWMSEGILLNVAFKGNQSDEKGGGLYNSESLREGIILVNNLFVDNEAVYGGGIYNTTEEAEEGKEPEPNAISRSTLINVTFSGNQASDGGGGIYNQGGSHELINCILWENSAPEDAEIHNSENGTASVSFSDIQGGYSGEDNLSEPPKFVAPEDGDYRLSDSSPLIDQGDNAIVISPIMIEIPSREIAITIDLDGRLRIVDGKGEERVDMGAYEFSAPMPVNPAPQGGLWASAYTNIQDALAAAKPGDQIWVAEGVYYPDEGKGQTDDDPTATFELKPGVALYGGFAGGERSLQDRDTQRNLTILSGDLGQDDSNTPSRENIAGYRMMTATTINGTNAYHVVSSNGVTETARLEGFIITAGNANDDNGHQNGGGMYNAYSSPTLVNITFSGNTADYDGGAMYNVFSSPTLTDITFNGNTANNGGGMFNYATYSTLTRVTFKDNHATADGGGMYNYQNSDPVLINNIFSHNHASNGGGMFNQSASNPTLVNTLFGNNQANHGGSMFNSYSNPTIINATFGGNQANNSGGAIYNDYSNPTLANTILWSNQASEKPEIYNANGSAPNISFSSMPGGHPGEGNINQDPLFVDPANGNYRLSGNSPLIDQGNIANFIDIIGLTDLTDLAGNPRFVNLKQDGEGEAQVDIGAFERQRIDSLIYLPLILSSHQ